MIVTVLGALYVHWGGLSAVKAIFYGVSPAVIALILHSCYRLTKLGMKDWLEWALAAAAFVITVALRAEVALLFIACGVVGVLYYGSLFRGRTPRRPRVAPGRQRRSWPSARPRAASGPCWASSSRSSSRPGR